MTPQTLFEKLELFENGEKHTLINSLKFAIKCAFAEKFTLGEERPCEQTDFIESRKYTEEHILYLSKIIDYLIKSNYFNKENFFSLDSHLLPLILILCGENVACEPWNTEKSVQNCQKILHQILEVLKCDGVLTLLQTNNGRVLTKNVLQLIRPKLLSNTWKCNPAAVSTYNWILNMIIQPDLSFFLPSVLPTALLLVDDYVNTNRIMGVKCLNHIVSNLTIAELQFHGHGDVIYNALLPLVRIKESDIIKVTIPCLVILASKMEVDLGKKNLTQWSKFDDILEIYLENMELEQVIDLRNTYLSNLFLILNAADFKIIRWTKRLFRIFKEYLKTAGYHSDSTTTQISLKVIEKFINVTKSGNHLYAKEMICIILIAFYNTVVEYDSDSQKNNEEICIKLIKEMLSVMAENEKNEFCIELMTKLKDNKHFCEYLDPIFKT